MSIINPPHFEEDIDEAEEEALLKSDDEIEAAAKIRTVPQSASGSGLIANADSPKIKVSQLEYDDSVDAVSESNDVVGISEENDDDDDDDDEDDLDEADKILTEYKTIVKELENQKYAYDKYLRLCELSHATGDLDYIRKAYSLFANVYPLAPELWLKYLNIEASVALSKKEVENVEYLFRLALRDYYSEEVATQFAALAIRTTHPEEIWNEILGTFGIHCMKGHAFFKQYRQYIASHPTFSAEEQQNAYIQSFLKELKYPLYNMEESYIEFKVFYEKNKNQIACEVNWELLDKNYFKCKEHLQKIMPFEEKLEALEKNKYRERSDVYLKYIKESDKFLDENVLQTVYERMVADCCLSADCWLTYIDFIDYRDEFGRPAELQDLPVFQQKAVDVNNRALRNCTWSEKLYIKRIQLLEKLDKSREEIQEVLESSLSAGFQTAEPVVAIWLEYLTYLRRHTDWENEGECDILRKNFNLCWTILGQQWGVLADCNCEILQFWGRLEYGPLQDAKRGKELWTTVMESSDNGIKSGLWIEFIQLEMRRDLESTRKLFRKALNIPGLDNPLVIASAWTRFERCNGTMTTLLLCTKECEEFIHQYKRNAHSLQSNKLVAGKGTKRKSSSAPEVMHEKKSKSVEKSVKSPSQDHRATTTTATTSSQHKHQEKDATFKEHENQEIDLTKDHLRIFLSNLDYNLNEDEIRIGLPELNIVKIDLIRSSNGKSRGFGYLELSSAAGVEKALALDRRSLNGRPIFVSSVLRDKEKRQKFKYSDSVEPKKLFLKGLAPDTNKEQLEEIYTAFGKLKDVRLVYHKSGKFKNIAYIEYEEEHAAGKAVLATDQMELSGHIISVAISAPPPKPNTAPAINPTKLLGMNPRRAKVFDQKPRMSLIPNVVRKNLVPTSTLSSNGTAIAKTNEDFRKLLQKPNII